jgi:hypothetical protein
VVGRRLVGGQEALLLVGEVLVRLEIRAARAIASIVTAA